MVCRAEGLHARCTCDAPPGQPFPAGCTCTVNQLNEWSGLPIAAWAYASAFPRRPVIGINHTSNWTLDYAWPGDSLVFGAPLELPVHVALSVGNWSPPRPPISFLAVEVAQPDPTDPTHQPTDVLPRSARQLWSDFQDSGFRIAIVGASDNRCFQRQIGQLRTGVLIDGAVTYEKYLEGLRLGRTQAVKGQGTVADLTAWSSSTPGDVKIIGDTLAVSSGSQVNFRVQATLKVAGMIELLGNGQPQPWCQMMGQVGTNDFTCGPIAMLSSAWMSVRAPLVQTSPIYVELDGVPYRPYNAALCRNISHIQRLIDTYAGPGGPLFSRLGAYLNAQAEYQARMDPAGPNCSSPPAPPTPTCPPDDEQNPFVPGQEYGDYFFGFTLPTGPVNQRVTGTLIPKKSLDPNAPIHTYPQPFAPSLGPPPYAPDPSLPPEHPLNNPTCTSPNPDQSQPGWDNWSCPDVDHFVVPATCGAAGTYLRARAVLWTEVQTRDVYQVNFCWSDPGTLCWANGLPHVNWAPGVTNKGGGTTVDWTVDVRCAETGRTYFLNIDVLNRSMPDEGQGNWTPEPNCDEYSLFYSVEQTTDGYVPGITLQPINP